MIDRINADPEVLLVRNFVSAVEAIDLIAAADRHFDRSMTVCADPSGCAIPDRTSSSAAVPASATTKAIQARGMVLVRAPSAEEIQVVRYFPGQEFKPHLDAFDGSDGGRRERAGGQRSATILIYLTGPEEGGETIFPRLGLAIAPVPFSAVVWRNTLNGAVDPRVLHGGAPVRRGVKYAANLWLRDSEDDPVRDWKRGLVDLV